MFICGDFTHGRKKPCKYCEHFMLWGISTGMCCRSETFKDVMTWDHCKYFKRDSEYWTKDGRCKVGINELYL